MSARFACQGNAANAVYLWMRAKGIFVPKKSLYLFAPTAHSSFAILMTVAALFAK